MPRCVTCKEHHAEDNFKVFNRVTHRLEMGQYCRSCRKKHRRDKEVASSKTNARAQGTN
jgi:hypothetical protein